MNLSQCDICLFYLPFYVDTAEVVLHCHFIFVGPLQKVRPRNGILCLGLVVLVVLVVLVAVLVPLRSEFIGEL